MKTSSGNPGQESAEIAKNLAENIVVLRDKAGLSQSELGKRAGIPRTTISQLESGSGNPSLQNLIKVSSALRVSIEELLVAPRLDVQLYPSKEVPEQVRSSGQIRVRKLLPDPIPGMEIDRFDLQPQARMGGHPHTSGTKEYFFCSKGAITIRVEGQEFRLGTGDLLAFPGDKRHSYYNHGSSKAEGFSVVAIAR